MCWNVSSGFSGRLSAAIDDLLSDRLWLGPAKVWRRWLGRSINRVRLTRSSSPQTQTHPTALALLVLPFVAPSVVNARSMWPSVSAIQDAQPCLFESLTRRLCAARSTPRSMPRPGATPKTRLAIAPKGAAQILCEIPRPQTFRMWLER